MTRSLIVTGGATGIGEAIARRAAEAGYRVGVLDVDEAGASRVASSLPDAMALRASVTDPDQVDQAIAEFGPSDVLVNNAGIVRFGPLLEQSVDDWRSVVDVNLTGVFVVSTACARAMAERGTGVIINITSINGISPGVNSGAYGATKSAIDLLSKQMSIEWGPLGIRVNTVAPGLIDGGMSTEIYADPEARRIRSSKVPSGRLGTVEDVASAVLFLCSDEASYVTGQQLVVDGGIINSIIANLPRPAAVDNTNT